MNGYICFGPGGKRVEVFADTTYAAQCKAAEVLKVPKNKQYKISVTLAEKNGEPVVHKPQDVAP